MSLSTPSHIGFFYELMVSLPSLRANLTGVLFSQMTRKLGEKFEEHFNLFHVPPTVNMIAQSAGVSNVLAGLSQLRNLGSCPLVAEDINVQLPSSPIWVKPSQAGTPDATPLFRISPSKAEFSSAESISTRKLFCSWHVRSAWNQVFGSFRNLQIQQ